MRSRDPKPKPLLGNFLRLVRALGFGALQMVGEVSSMVQIDQPVCPICPWDRGEGGSMSVGQMSSQLVGRTLMHFVCYQACRSVL